VETLPSRLEAPQPPAACSLYEVGLDSSLERLWVCTNHLSDLLAVLEEEEGRHGTDAEFLGNIGDFVDVELVKACFGVCV
jgi:hypothetical protein